MDRDDPAYRGQSDDTRPLLALDEILAASFDGAELEIVGSVVIFAATNPRMVSSH